MNKIEVVQREYKGRVEDVFLKRGKFGWRVVYPINHPVTNKIIKKNLWVGGSYWNLAKVGLIIVAILLLVLAYRHDIEAVKQACYQTIKITI